MIVLPMFIKIKKTFLTRFRKIKKTSKITIFRYFLNKKCYFVLNCEKCMVSRCELFWFRKDNRLEACSIQMCVHGSQTVCCCTTELCLSVDKLKEEKNKHKEGTMLVCRGNVVVYILSTVKLRVLTPLLD